MCDLTGPPWASDVSCHSELSSPSSLPYRPLPRRKILGPLKPPHLTLPPAHLHIPPPPGPATITWPSWAAGKTTGKREESPPRLLGTLFLPASSFPDLKVASLPPQEPEGQWPPSGTFYLTVPRLELSNHACSREGSISNRAPFSNFHSPQLQGPRSPLGSQPLWLARVPNKPLKFT